MGRKVSKRKSKIPSRLIQVLPIIFDCPFCSHESSCDVKFNRKKHRAQILCRVCFEKYETNVHHLNEPIDVYNAWIDACEDANKNQTILS